MTSRLFAGVMLERLGEATLDMIGEEKSTQLDSDPEGRALVIGRATAVIEIFEWARDWAEVLGLAGEGIPIPDFDVGEAIREPWSPR